MLAEGFFSSFSFSFTAALKDLQGKFKHLDALLYPFIPSVYLQM